MLLRVRIVGSQGVLTFKGTPDYSKEVKEREEIECDVEDAESLIRILLRIGFSLLFRYQKYRTVYKVEGMPLEISMDETPIGNYLELEGEIDSIHECARRLGFLREQYILESYATLYDRWCRENNRTIAYMTFE